MILKLPLNWFILFENRSFNFIRLIYASGIEIIYGAPLNGIPIISISHLGLNLVQKCQICFHFSNSGLQLSRILRNIEHCFCSKCWTMLLHSSMWWLWCYMIRAISVEWWKLIIFLVHWIKLWMAICIRHATLNWTVRWSALKWRTASTTLHYRSW